MAKQTKVINRFDGGINDQFSQQDIPDNALVSLLEELAEDELKDKDAK